MIKYLLSSFLFISTAQAADIGLSVRALGMGNAYTAVVNDGDSIFYNPAGLGKMKGFNWTIFDGVLGVNKGDSFEDYLDIAEDSSDITSIMNQLYGEAVTIYSGGKSLFSIGGLSFGAYGVADGNFLVNNPAFPNIETAYRLDYGFVFGWGFQMADMLSLGVQTRRVTRQGGSLPIGVATIATLDSDTIQNELNRSGSAYAFDWGATLSLPAPMKPTLSFSWRDMGNTTFRADDGGVAPDPVLQEHILGFGLTFESGLMDINTAIDYRFLNDSTTQIGKKLNMGVEVSWPILDVRAGLHQGYYTLGSSFDLWFFRVDAATYGVELGAYPGQLEDRRYMLQFSFDFGVDPGNFNLFKLSRPSTRNHSRKLRR